MSRRYDDGTILLLTIGYVLVALAFVLVVVDVSKVFLERRSLAAACDGAALRAAQQASAGALYADSAAVGSGLPLDEQAVQEQVAVYVAQAYPGDTAQFTAAADGDVAVVNCRTQVSLPGGGLLGPRLVTVTAHAEARSPFRLP